MIFFIIKKLYLLFNFFLKLYESFFFCSLNPKNFLKILKFYFYRIFRKKIKIKVRLGSVNLIIYYILLFLIWICLYIITTIFFNIRKFGWFFYFKTKNNYIILIYKNAKSNLFYKSEFADFLIEIFNHTYIPFETSLIKFYKRRLSKINHIYKKHQLRSFYHFLWKLLLDLQFKFMLFFFYFYALYKVIFYNYDYVGNPLDAVNPSDNREYEKKNKWLNFLPIPFFDAASYFIRPFFRYINTHSRIYINFKALNQYLYHLYFVESFYFIKNLLSKIFFFIDSLALIKILRTLFNEYKIYLNFFQYLVFYFLLKFIFPYKQISFIIKFINQHFFNIFCNFIHFPFHFYFTIRNIYIILKNKTIFFKNENKLSFFSLNYFWNIARNFSNSKHLFIFETELTRLLDKSKFYYYILKLYYYILIVIIIFFYPLTLFFLTLVFILLYFYIFFRKNIRISFIFILTIFIMIRYNERASNYFYSICLEYLNFRLLIPSSRFSNKFIQLYTNIMQHIFYNYFYIDFTSSRSAPFHEFSIKQFIINMEDQKFSNFEKEFMQSFFLQEITNAYMKIKNKDLLMQSFFKDINFILRAFIKKELSFFWFCQLYEILYKAASSNDNFFDKSFKKIKIRSQSDIVNVYKNFNYLSVIYTIFIIEENYVSARGYFFQLKKENK
jgi:hypothetical protein